MASSRSFRYICGSLKKIKSGRCFSVKCFRFNAFLEKPSIFHVKEENDVEDDLNEDAGCEEASTTRVDLSEDAGLTPAEKPLVLVGLE